MKIALAQIEVIPGRPDINVKTMLDAIDQAKISHAQLVVFPEMALPGYLLGDTWEQTVFLKDCEEFGQQIIQAANNIVVAFGNVAIDWNKVGNDGRPRKYNAFFVAQNGSLCGDENFPYPYRIKTLQPNYREFDDDRHFYSSLKLAQELDTGIEQLLTPVNISIDGKPVSLGCILCEDGWDEDYTVKPVRILQHAGADIILNISCSPFTLGKNSKRNRVFGQQARDLGIPVVYTNNTGLQNNGKTIYCFDGQSCIYDSNGNILLQLAEYESKTSSTTVELQASSDELEPTKYLSSRSDSIEGIYSALCYAGQKMLSSIGMNKVVIGASGGIDSAIAAALYCRILGPQNVLLVNMPSRYNSETTQSLASRLANNLQCLYTVVPIEESATHTLEQLTNSPIIDLSTGKQIALQVAPLVAENIQARDRSARVLAAFAAAIGGGFTCNANKAEMTVGYCTLYGDQAGVLAILADLWKYQVYALGKYMNDVIYQREVIPQGIFDVVPSAELSDTQDVDAGEGDPLHYPYHDHLFRSFMEWWQPACPEEILRWYQEGALESKLGCKAGTVDQLFASPAEFIEDLERWWKQFKGIGVAKRIQAPPVVAVSRRAYGFDYREAQNSVYFSKNYRALKNQILTS